MTKKANVNLGKEVYKELRTHSWESLWADEVPLFDAGTPEYRRGRVGLVRALGVVVLKKTTQEQKALTKQWLISLLQDPEEKVRRYAMAALPKLGGKDESERALLDLLDEKRDPREIKHLSRSLDKVGGAATLEKLDALGEDVALPQQTEQKVKAQVARKDQPRAIRMDAKLSRFRGLRIHLRTRRGMEQLVREELFSHPRLKDRFKLLKVSVGCLAITTQSTFTLAELYELRTFGSVHFVLGIVPQAKEIEVAAFAEVIASPLSQRLCKELTLGQPRYRLDFIRTKVPRSTTLAIANAAFELCGDLLNDPRQSPWAIDVYPEKVGHSVELSPRIIPDPRFTYRVDDVPASTHPPLAAAMAQVAEPVDGDVVWDPFCGSAQELIECVRLAKLAGVIATDVDAQATEVAQLNFKQAGLDAGLITVETCDFREASFAPERVSLIICNPPLGRRVRVADMKSLFDEIFKVANKRLQPGGRFVLLNPLKPDTVSTRLSLESSQKVDVGGFDCRLEKWVKA